MKRDEDKKIADSGGGPGAIASGAVYTTTFLLPAYIPATLIGELFGNRGVPASPWLMAPVVILAISVMMRFEPYLQGRSWWPRVDDVWGALLLGLSVVLPIVVAVAWPMSFWSWLPPVVPTLLSFVPVAFTVWCVKRWHRHLWKKQRPQLGPYRPIPRINSQGPNGPSDSFPLEGS
ncbi:hypothetical protein [Streptomyces sp. YS-3]|uniref:hypothetical protein n=1 Tax=Streptomyces sp. YS-3 TaxID=3381352 RepID=UPI003862CDCC